MGQEQSGSGSSRRGTLGGGPPPPAWPGANTSRGPPPPIPPVFPQLVPGDEKGRDGEGVTTGGLRGV